MGNAKGLPAELMRARINPEDLRAVLSRAKEALNSAKQQVGAGSIPGELVRTGTTWNPRGPNRGI